MNRFSSWISLFASTGTLLCCALPSLLVTLGMGAAMAGLISTVPQISWLSQNKLLVFSGSGVMIIFACCIQYVSGFQPCPTDKAKADSCKKTGKWSFTILMISIVIWCTGSFFAFLAPKIFS